MTKGRIKGEQRLNLDRKRASQQYKLFFAIGGSVERIRHVFKMGYTAAAANLMVGALLTLLNWSNMPPLFHAVWLMLLATMALYFAKSRNYSDRLKIRHISNRTRRRIAVFAALIGLLWVPYAIMAVSAQHGIDQAATLCLLWVLNLGAMVVFCPIPFAVSVFSCIGLLPFVILAAMSGSLASISLAAATLLLIVAMLSFSMTTSTLVFELEDRAKRSHEEMRQLTIAHEENRRLAREDQLTGLLNRRAFLTLTDAAVGSGMQLALFMIDLDHFKPVNDGLGHDFGDRYLAHVGDVLRKVCEDNATPARLGGDEFAVLTDRPMSRKQIASFGSRLQHALRGPVQIEGKEIQVSASIGVAIASGAELSTPDWLRYADHALIVAKQSRGSLHVFGDADYNRIKRRTRMGLELEAAIRGNDFSIAYQPQINLQSGVIEGFEALARWTDRSGLPVAPQEFIEVAESKGLVLDLCDALLSRITQDIAQWHNAGIETRGLSVNIHQAQLHYFDNLLVGLDKIRRKMPPHALLTLEITEDIIIGRGIEDIPSKLARLRKDGYRISLDDFGTGYASLTHIRDLEIDQVKIDRGFVSDMSSNAHDEEIVRSILKIARSLDLEVVAEGVETMRHHRLLDQMGCQSGQGFLYSKGVPAKEVPALIQDLKGLPLRDTQKARQA